MQLIRVQLNHSMCLIHVLYLWQITVSHAVGTQFYKCCLNPWNGQTGEHAHLQGCNPYLWTFEKTNRMAIKIVYFGSGAWLEKSDFSEEMGKYAIVHCSLCVTSLPVNYNHHNWALPKTEPAKAVRLLPVTSLRSETIWTASQTGLQDLKFHHIYTPLSTDTPVIATPSQILPFKIDSYCSWGWQRKWCLFKAIIIFSHKIIFRWKWHPFPKNFTNTLGLHYLRLSLTILEQDGELAGDSKLIGQLPCQHSSSLWAWGREMGRETAGLINTL